MIKKGKHTIKKGIILFVILSVLLLLPDLGHAVSQIEEKFNLLMEVYGLVSEYHIHDVDDDTLIQGAIDGMIDTLDDPYTAYFSDEEYQSFTNSIDGSYKGIGIYIEEKDGYIMVQSPIPNSPAEKAGLKAGDAIIKVDGIDIVGETTEAASSLIKGEEGTFVTLTILREGKTYHVDVKRGEIQLPLVESDMLTKEVGYIRLYTFSDATVKQFKQQLNQLTEAGMTRLVLDLRNNPGGYLDAVLEISKNFIEEGPIVYVTNKAQEEEMLGIEGGQNWDKPMVVLIDGGTASAAEILTAALKEYGKATVIGTTSFGKGTVQTLVPLQHGGYLKLTVNEYFTPNKNKMNGVGITPDIEVPDVALQLQTAVSKLSEQVYLPTIGEDWLQIEGKNYIALRQMVESLNGTVTWNPQTKAIEAELFGDHANFIVGQSEGLMVKNGTSYIQLRLIETYFPNTIAKQVKEIVTIYQR